MAQKQTQGMSKIEDLKARLDIVEVAARYTRLKKVGSRHSGLCPFHDEKTPSFTVTPAKGIYKCFGCGAGGDVLDLMCKAEKLSMSELLQRYETPEALACIPERKQLAAPKPAPAKLTVGPPKVIPAESMEPYLAQVMDSPLIRYWAQWYSESHLKAICQRYLIGHGNTGTLFYQTDLQGQVLNAKVQQYTPKGKREGNVKHLHTGGQGYTTGLFGLHLLSKYRHGTICIVEGEKNAFVGALQYPQFCWLATGAAYKELPPEAIRLLKTCEQVVLWPDNDSPGAKWLERLLEHLPCAIDASTQYSSNAKGWDIADEVEQRQLAKVHAQTDVPAPIQLAQLQVMETAFALVHEPTLIDAFAKVEMPDTAPPESENLMLAEDDRTAKQVEAFFGWYPWPQQPIRLDKAHYIRDPVQFITTMLASIKAQKGKARTPYVRLAHRFMMALEPHHL